MLLNFAQAVRHARSTDHPPTGGRGWKLTKCRVVRHLQVGSNLALLAGMRGPALHGVEIFHGGRRPAALSCAQSLLGNVNASRNVSRHG